MYIYIYIYGLSSPSCVCGFSHIREREKSAVHWLLLVRRPPIRCNSYLMNLIRYLTAKLALNYLIDRLEKPGSTRARGASRADSLQVKQWGVVCHMSMPSLSARDLQLQEACTAFASLPSSFHLYSVSTGRCHLVLWQRSADTESWSHAFFLLLLLLLLLLFLYHKSYFQVFLY